MDLRAVQGTLKSLLQHHSSKASILWHSAFFTVQLSHPYMTTGKTIASTRSTFAGKVMSLLLNMLSRLVITFLPRSKRLNFMAAVTICSDFAAAAAAAKSLQSCPTLCDPMTCSPPGFSVHGILQARTLEWVAISFSKCMKVKSESEVAQLCPTLCDPMDCSLPGFSVHGIFQARVPESVAFSFCRGSSRPKNRTKVSRIAGRHFTL